MPDERLSALARLVAPAKIVPASLEFVDIAGLIKGAAQGEGLGNQFLGHIQTVDAVAHVVRCFESDRVSHPHGEVDPVTDIEVVELELVLRDRDIVEKAAARLEKAARTGDDKAADRLEVLRGFNDTLRGGRLLVDTVMDPTSRAVATQYGLVTAKPYFFVANLSEDQLSSDGQTLQQLKDLCRKRQRQLVDIAALAESELIAMPPEERREFERELGMKAEGLGRIVETGYRVLGLNTFFTTAGSELRAWTVPAGTTAWEAAGKIHTDMQRGFIRAEVVNWKQLVEAGGEQAARDRGLVRTEGRDYPVADGDVIRFRFNV